MEPVRPERLDRDHGHGHGPDHRVAQHRPLRGVDARPHRLHHGHDPGDLAAPGLRGQLPRTLDLGRRTGRRHRDRRRHGCDLGHDHRLPGRPVLHRDPRRPARLARPDLPLPAGPDARPPQRHLRAPRRWAQGIARRHLQLDPRRSHLHRHHLHAVGRPAPQEAVRVPRPSAVGRGGGGRDRLRRGARGRLPRQQLHVAAQPRRPVGQGDRQPDPARRHPDRRRDPGRDHAPAWGSS